MTFSCSFGCRAFTEDLHIARTWGVVGALANSEGVDGTAAKHGEEPESGVAGVSLSCAAK